MNLKEAFRYQKFLDNLMYCASRSVTNRDHSMLTTKTHMRHSANPDAQDVVETVASPEAFYSNDEVICFMQNLISEKDALSVAIGRAKASAGFDIDAAIEANKCRRTLVDSIKTMLRYQPKKWKESGRDYKFDVNGVQTPYLYDVEIESKEAFDRTLSKSILRDVVSTADDVSAKVDAALINIDVAYYPPYNVNDTFEDVIAEFLGDR